MKNTFLFRTYREFKLLFLVLIVFMVGTLWFALKSREEFPFLLFGMYSLKEEAQETYVSYVVNLHGKDIVYSDLPDAKRELITSPLQQFYGHPREHIDEVGFNHWLFVYLVKLYTPEGMYMKVFKQRCSYNTAGKPRILKRELLFDLHENR